MLEPIRQGPTGMAIAYYGIGTPMSVTEYPLPVPEPGAILIKVRLATVCGSDLHVIRGDIDYRGAGLPVPIILGHEMMGEISALGEGVSQDSDGQKLAVGDRVVYSFFCPCGACPFCVADQDLLCPNMRADRRRSSEVYPYFHGAFAEFFYLRPRHIILRAPDNMSDELLAPVNCGLATMVSAFKRLGPIDDQVIVFQGAGALGLYGSALARTLGARSVIVIDRSRTRLDMALSFGASTVISFSDYPTAVARMDRVQELSGGLGAHVVVDACGTSDAIAEGISMLRPGGRYLEVGSIGGKPSMFEPWKLVFGRKDMITSNLWTVADLRDSLALLRTYGPTFAFDKIVGAVFPMREIEAAVISPDLDSCIRIGLRP